jgi:hypothetical protein
MANFLGELLFGLIRSLIWGFIESIGARVYYRVLVWMETRIKGRAAIVLGLLIGLAPIALIVLMLWSDR